MEKTGLAAVHAAVDQPNMIARAEHDAAVAAAHTGGVAEGAKQGATAERARCGAILESKEAAGRGALAQHLAFETDMAAEGAIALLAKSPKEAEAKASRLDGKVPSPNLSAAAPSGPQDIAASWDTVVAQVNKK